MSYRLPSLAQPQAKSYTTAMSKKKPISKLKIVGLALAIGLFLLLSVGRGLIASLFETHYARTRARHLEAVRERIAKQDRQIAERIRGKVAAHEVVANPTDIGGQGDIRFDAPVFYPGVNEPMPEPTTRIVLLPETANDRTGHDDAVRINQAIAQVTAPAEITLRAGVYIIQSPIILKSGVVLRGEGMRKTVLFSLNGENCIALRGDATEIETEVQSGADRNSDVLTVADASAFKAGDMVRVYAKVPAYVLHWGQVGNVAEVTDEHTLRLDKALRLTCHGGYPVYVRVFRPIRSAGIESLTLETSAPAPDKRGNMHGVQIDRAVNCWVRGCEFSHSRTSHIWVADSRFVTVEGNYFHHGWGYRKNQGYGICLADYATDCLVADNAYDTLRHAMIAKTGANGNVFAYNYSVGNNPQGNKDDSCDLSIHGLYAHSNLVEGNVIQFAQSSDYFGSAGPLITFFRNRVEGLGILITYSSHFPVIVGNDFVRGGIYVELRTVGLAIEGNKLRGRDIPSKIIYDGYQCPQYDAREYPNGRPKLRASLFLDDPPEFLKDTPWPPFGPDVTGESVLPAEKRHREIYSTWSKTAVLEKTGTVPR